jgi:uncharacterized membrane protein YphA (DoxX/SURF4 family)
MDLRNKWAIHIIRTLLGLLFIAMSIMGLYFITSGTIPEVPGSTDATRAAEQGLMLAGITYVVKIIELVAGIMLLLNFRPAFANLLLAPIVVGIMTYDLSLWMHVPASIIPAGFAFLAVIYLGHVYWDKYKAVFEK